MVQGGVALDAIRSCCVTGVPESQVPLGPDLRAKILSLHPSDIGLEPTDDLPRVWGVLMDMGMAAGWATVMTLADGTTSLYTSGTFGIIGAGAHPTVASASSRLLRKIESNLDIFEATSQFEPPAGGDTRFLVLTYDGIHARRGPSDTLAKGGDPLSPIFDAGQELLTKIRLASAPAMENHP